MSRPVDPRWPWLAHRPVHRGVPVPWINAWGEEHVDQVSIRHDRHVGGPAVFYDDSAETVPDFTRQHMARQRESVLGGLCQVCGGEVPWSRRFLVLATLSVERIRLGVRQVPVVVEPWLCERCARLALDRCPALIRRRRDEELHLVPVTSKRQVRLILSKGWVDGPLEAESRRVQPAMWAKILLPGLALNDASSQVSAVPTAEASA